MDDLPEGFVVDSAPQASSDLPEGFQIDHAAPSPTDQAAKGIESVPAGARYPWLAARGAAQAVPFSRDIASAVQATVGKLPTFQRPPGDTWAERFKNARATQEALDRAAMRDYPVTSIGGEVAGAMSLPLGGATDSIAAKVAPYVGNKFAPAAALGTIGAGYGGLSGLGSSGDVGERLRAGATGAATGAVAGAAAPLVGDYIVDPAAQTASWIARRMGLSRPSTIAQSEYVKGLESAAKYPGQGMTPGQWAAAYGEGQPVMPIDLGGNVLRRTAKTAANVSEEAEGILKDALNARNASQQSRLYDYASDLTGKDLSDPTVIDALRQRATAANTPAYQAAMDAARQRGGVHSPRLESILNDSSVKSKIPDAIDHLNDLNISGKLPGYQPGAPIEPPVIKGKDGSWKVPTDVAGNPIAPPLEFWDQLKKEVQSFAESKKPTPLGGGDSQTHMMASNAANAIKNELFAQAPEYKSAVEGAGKFLGEQDAFNFGQKFLSASKPAIINDSIKKIAQMTPEQLDYAQHNYMMGRINDYMKMAQNRNVGSVSASTSPMMQAKDRAILGNDVGDKLNAFLMRENIMNRALQGLGGSDTAKNIASGSKFLATHGVGALSGAVTGAGAQVMKNDYNPADIAKGAATGALAGAFLQHMTNMGEKTAVELARKLVSEDPEALKEALGVVVKDPNAMRAIRQVERSFVSTSARSPELIAEQKKAQEPLLLDYQPRAAGGRVQKRDYPAKKTSRLEKEANRACKQLGGALKPLMDIPDEHIAHALRIAKQ